MEWAGSNRLSTPAFAAAALFHRSAVQGVPLRLIPPHAKDLAGSLLRPRSCPFRELCQEVNQWLNAGRGFDFRSIGATNGTGLIKT